MTFFIVTPLTSFYTFDSITAAFATFSLSLSTPPVHVAPSCLTLSQVEISTRFLGKVLFRLQFGASVTSTIAAENYTLYFTRFQVWAGIMFYACLQAVRVRTQKPGWSLTDKKPCIDFPFCDFQKKKKKINFGGVK